MHGLPQSSQPRPKALALPIPVVMHCVCTCWQHHRGPPINHRPGPGHQLCCILSSTAIAVQTQLTFSGVSILSRSQLQRSLSGMCMNCSQNRLDSAAHGSTRRHGMARGIMSGGQTVIQYRSSRRPGMIRALAGAQECLAAAARRCQFSMGQLPEVVGLMLPEQAPAVSSRLPACTLSSIIKGLSAHNHAWQLHALDNPQNRTMLPATLHPTGGTTAAKPGS